HSAPFDFVFDMPMIPAGGCWSTATDLAVFLRAALDGFAGFLDPELVIQMHKVPGSLAGQRGGYGLGVDTLLPPHQLLYGHGGGGCGFLTDLYWAPTPGLGVAVLTNDATH